VYNKSRSYLERLAGRLGGSISVVDDGDHDALRAALRPTTALVFAETFTNPLMRAQDPPALAAICRAQKGVKLVIDDTIATPWALERPLLEMGVDVVVASGTKALGGQDRDMWGYVATNDSDLGNQVMDLVALRGGNLDWRRAEVIAAELDGAKALHARRCDSATAIARFLERHPRVAEVFHPSLPDHPDAAAIAAHYRRHGSLVSFRVKDADEQRTRHLADALATTVVVRYALSFDGLCTKVNHHQTVSEYFTPPDRLKRDGFDRLIRLGVGTEDPDDVIAALNWMLHHGDELGSDELDNWQAERAASLALG
jgi:cystathionine gamma-synthase